jgi:ribosomal-protein-alanine N-acetyltransferase
MEIARASILDLGALERFDQVCFPKDAWNLLERIVVLLSPAIVRLKVVEDGRMVAFAAGRKAGVDGVGWIQSIGVLPEFRRRGLARRLLHSCETRLEAPRVRLFVRASNAVALWLYEGEGYARRELRVGFYSDGEDAVIMERVKGK